MTWIGAALVCAFVGAVIAGRKGAAGAGFLWGLLLGPLGVLIAIFLDDRPECPMCRNPVNNGARICGSCRSQLAWRRGDPFTPEGAARQRETEAATVRALAKESAWTRFCYWHPRAIWLAIAVAIAAAGIAWIAVWQHHIDSIGRTGL